MGACVSSRHKSSAMKVHTSSESNHKPDDPFSSIKEKLPIIDGSVPVKPQWPPLHSTLDSRDFGSKEETFFDSQTWLESDCESDFMSVRGEFTPSRGNTPVHGNFLATTPPVKGGAPVVNGYALSMTESQPSTIPIKKHKRLSELFKESPRVNHKWVDKTDEPTNENGMVGSLEVAEAVGGRLKPKRERWVQIVQVNGCLPRVLSSCRPVTPQQMEVRRKQV